MFVSEHLVSLTATSAKPLSGDSNSVEFSTNTVIPCFTRHSTTASRFRSMIAGSVFERKNDVLGTCCAVNFRFANDRVDFRNAGAVLLQCGG